MHTPRISAPERSVAYEWRPDRRRGFPAQIERTASAAGEERSFPLLMVSAVMCGVSFWRIHGDCAAAFASGAFGFDGFDWASAFDVLRQRQRIHSSVSSCFLNQTMAAPDVPLAEASYNLANHDINSMNTKHGTCPHISKMGTTARNLVPAPTSMNQHNEQQNKLSVRNLVPISQDEQNQISTSLNR